MICWQLGSQCLSSFPHRQTKCIYSSIGWNVFFMSVACKCGNYYKHNTQSKTLVCSCCMCFCCGCHVALQKGETITVRAYVTMLTPKRGLYLEFMYSNILTTNVLLDFGNEWTECFSSAVLINLSPPSGTAATIRSNNLHKQTRQHWHGWYSSYICEDVFYKDIKMLFM